jgi:hypothetical protein
MQQSVDLKLPWSIYLFIGLFSEKKCLDKFGNLEGTCDWTVVFSCRVYYSVIQAQCKLRIAWHLIPGKGTKEGGKENNLGQKELRRRYGQRWRQLGAPRHAAATVWPYLRPLLHSIPSYIFSNTTSPKWPSLQQIQKPLQNQKFNSALGCICFLGPKTYLWLLKNFKKKYHTYISTIYVCS